MEEEQKKENLEAIEPKINNAIENNSKISDEFSDLAKACFGRIFYMLGEKNFRRWINTRQINKQIKSLVMQSMTKEEMENEPSTLGYYRRGKNEIRLSQNHSKDSIKDTNVHETFHLITDHKNNFCTFLDEGLTEYLKGMAINESNSYKPNVNSVKFLHEILGDSLIKSYLIGKDGFDEQMLDLINYDNSSSISDVKKFYSNLNKFHEYYVSGVEKEVFESMGATPEVIERATQRNNNAKKEYDIVKPQILSMYQKIIVGRISEMAKNMEFYKTGENGIELDLEEALKTINGIMEKVNIKDFIEGNFIACEKWKNQVSRLAAEQVLENSHVLEGYTDEEREVRKQELIEKITPSIIATNRQITTTSPTIKNSDILPEENSNMVSKLFEKRLSSDMNITQYIENVTKIARTMNISDSELENYLNKYNIQYFGDVVNFKKVNETIRLVSPKIQKLSDIENQRKKDTITSQYKSIGNGRFIEKRDNQIFFVELDEKGDFSEQEIKLSRETIWLKDRTRIDIDCRKGLPNLEVKMNGKPVKTGKILNLQDIKDMEIADAFSKDIEKNIRNGKYTRILDDAENPWKTEGMGYTSDVDKRSREIIFDQYISDLKSIIKIIPESQRDDLIRSKSEMLLDKTFRIPKKREPDGTMKRDENVEIEYRRFSNSISTGVGKDSLGNLELKSIKHSLEVLSIERNEIVEKNSKSAAIVFRDENAKKNYERIKRSEAIRDSNKALKEVPKSFDCSPFYEHEGEIPLDEIPFHLKGVTTTQRVDSRNVKFLYNNFAEAAKNLLSKYPSIIQDSLLEEIFDKQMQETFLVSNNTETKPEIIEALDNVRAALDDKILSDIEIDDEKISESLSILNSNRIEIVKENCKKMGIKFASKDAENMFNSFVDLLDIVKNSGITSGEVTDMVKGIMSAQMEKDDGKNNPDRDE